MDTIKNTVCLCLIVKNESKVIKRMIDSCRDIIDSWLIIDTGSVDDSKEIISRELKNIPGELLESKWVDFATNRTELVQKAKNKATYLLILDADITVVLNKSFDKQSLSHQAYYIRHLGELDYAKLLLVRTDLNWYYKNVVHEYITADDFNEKPVVTDMMMIRDYYDGSNQRDDVKTLLESIKKEPTNARNYFYLAQSYLNNEEYSKAIDNYKNRVNLGGWQEEVYYSLYQIGVCYYHIKDNENAKRYLLEAYNYRPSRFESLYHLGLIYRNENKHNLALLYLETIESIGYPDDILFIHRDQWEYKVYFELAICYYWIGEYKLSLKYSTLVDNVEDVTEEYKAYNDKNMKYAQDKLK